MSALGRKAGQHDEDARGLLRRRGIDGADFGMGVGRAQDLAVGLARQVDIAGKASPAGQEPPILLAQERLPEPVRLHRPTLRHQTSPAPLARARRPSKQSGCTTGKERRITRWEHEPVLEAVQRRLDEHPE